MNLVIVVAGLSTSNPTLLHVTLTQWNLGTQWAVIRGQLVLPP